MSERYTCAADGCICNRCAEAFEAELDEQIRELEAAITGRTVRCERCAELEAKLERARQAIARCDQARANALHRACCAEAQRDRLRDRLRLVVEAVEHYRSCHDALGDGHLEAGRAWMGMRRGIEDARKTLAEGDQR